MALSRRSATLLGIALSAGLAATMPAFVSAFEREPLYVEHDEPLWTSEAGELEAGLQHRRWTREYRGPHRQSVGHTQLVGPLQDLDDPRCDLQFLIGHELLGSDGDDEGSAAHVVRKLLEAELEGMGGWPVGRFRRVKDVSLQWIAWPSDGHLPLPGLLSEWRERGVTGHLEAKLTVRFEEASIPVTLSLIPHLQAGMLEFETQVRARLKPDSRIERWIADLFDGDRRASLAIKKELEPAMAQLIQTPPPIELDEDLTLEIEFCPTAQLQVSPHGYAAVPMRLALQSKRPGPPLRHTPAPLPSAPLESPFALVIGEDGLNALLHQLWSSGYLDRQLMPATVRAFNEHPMVRELLSLRLGHMYFHLPPTVTLVPERPDTPLHLRSAAQLRLHDGEQRTPARLYAELHGGLPNEGAPAVHIADFDLSCLEGERGLRPCYSIIREQLDSQRDQLQGALAEHWLDALREIVAARSIGRSQDPAHFELRKTEFRLVDRSLRVELEGDLLVSP